MIPTLPIEIACPSCGTKHVAQVHSIVDVGQDPELKEALLRGSLNAVACPACGALGMVSTPLLYHDPDNELLLIYIPPGLSLPLPERERLTGNLVNALMSTLPTEARKGYFLNPRTVLSMQSLMEEILQADGITKEMIEEQRARGKLLQDLLAAMDNEEQLTTLIQQNKDRIDYSFFLTLADAAESSAAAGQPSVAEKLLKLREILLTHVSITLPEPLPMDTPPAEIVDKLISAKDEQARWAMVVYNRPLLDYAFFQELTRRIDQATPEQAQSLRELRTELLELTEQLDKEAQAVQEAKFRLLQDALDSPDPAQTVRERRDEVDLAFMTILGAALRQAQESGEKARVEQLLELNEVVLSMLQEGLPPHLRLVNELLAIDDAQEREKLLHERQTEWDAEILEVLKVLQSDLESQGRAAMAQRLQEIRSEAEEILQQSNEQASKPREPDHSSTE
jgi:hypothetical protein